MTSQAESKRLINAMSVDVEDYFQVSAFEPHVSRASWEQTPLRVEGNVARILALFAQFDIKATFFTLGWVAERLPNMIREIVDQGHELASHGWEHTRVTTQEPESFRQDVIRTKHLLEDLGGVAVQGYRAASYSIGSGNLWAHDILADSGYCYSSSIVPVKHDLYGMPEAPRFAYRTAGDRLLEIPVTTVSVLGRNVNCGGGGWFRLFPYGFSKWALNRVNTHDLESSIFYFHPWEIDPQQPRPTGLSLKTRFRHYLNLGRMEQRLSQLAADFHWDRVDRVFLEDCPQTVGLTESESGLHQGADVAGAMNTPLGPIS